jgi:hypothetical protein
VSSFLLGPNILLNTLFSNTLSLRFFLNVSDQFSRPYKTGKKSMHKTKIRHTVSYSSQTFQYNQSTQNDILRQLS